MSVVDWILFCILFYLNLHYWNSWVNNDCAKSFFAFFLLTKCLHYYFHFTWFQYSAGLFPGNILFLLAVILLTICTFFFNLNVSGMGNNLFYFYVSVSDSTLSVFDFWPYPASLNVCYCTVIVSSGY